MSDKPNIVQRRPAEVGGVAGSLALLICKALGVDDPDTIVALGAVLGFLPAGITATVGWWRGRDAPPAG